MDNVPFSITLSYAELLALYSSVCTISCVYGEDPVRTGLLLSLEYAISTASNEKVFRIEVES